jgi:putative ABC transport system substrate-binding protein
MGRTARRRFLVCAGAVLAAPFAGAQPAPRLRRIGILADTAPPKGKVDGRRIWMRKGLERRGWLEGRDFVYEIRYAAGKAERYPALVDELIRLKVDVIIAPSEDGALAARAATRTIPIIMIYPLNPIRLGLIESYAHPGGNVTGLTYEVGSQTMIGKQLEMFKEAVPGISRVAVLWNPASAQSERWLTETRDPARRLSLEVLPIAVRAPEDLESAFSQMSERDANALYILADPMLYLHRAKLAELAVRRMLPALSGLYRWPQSGGLMAYEAVIPELYARATDYIDKILRGANPAELPVEQPTKFNLTVNLKTAKAIGITIPQSILLRADRVID